MIPANVCALRNSTPSTWQPTKNHSSSNRHFYPQRDLAVVGRAHPSLSVFKGVDVTLFCCVNVDPEGFIDVASVFFIQNGTIMREPTSHPFATQNGFPRRVHERHSCWELELKNAQPSDSGSYMCRVSASSPDLNVNDTMQFEVK
uniref:Ig-like domain-containing protein n=1 Tax=Caenorhabditis japonica TaxID=281687 RepID=A0A8R1IYR8_CAEJA